MTADIPLAVTPRTLIGNSFNHQAISPNESGVSRKPKAHFTTFQIKLTTGHDLASSYVKAHPLSGDYLLTNHKKTLTIRDFNKPDIFQRTWHLSSLNSIIYGLY